MGAKGICHEALEMHGVFRKLLFEGADQNLHPSKIINNSFIYFFIGFAIQYRQNSVERERSSRHHRHRCGNKSKG